MQLSNQQISFALNSIVTIVMPTENCVENDFAALERESENSDIGISVYGSE